MHKFLLVVINIVTSLIVIFMSTTPTNAQTLTFRNILDHADRPTPTHKIAYGTQTDQYGELWLPELTPDNKKTKLPIVILVHGGCWRADLPGPELVAFLAEDLRARGVAVWSITYRRVGTKDMKANNFAPYPDTFRDVAAATDKLRELATTYNLDLSRVITTGHSAGGHLAMWLAARPRLPMDSPLHAKDALPIRATVGIAAIPDLALGRTMSAHACGTDTVDLLIDTKTRGEAAFRDTSLTPLLPLGIPQTLVSGVYDAIVAPAQALRYRERAKEKGEVVKLRTLDDAGHFELIAPWTTPGQSVINEILGAIPAH